MASQAFKADGSPPIAVGDWLLIEGEEAVVEALKGERRRPDGGAVIELIIATPSQPLRSIALTRDELVDARQPTNDGRGRSAEAIACLWSHWMMWATPRIRSSVTATRPLTPFPHQDEAVFVHMLPQPRLRFLLADEPGTGKTAMTGMYIAEGQAKGMVRGKSLIVPPAHLVGKWIEDLRRLFGIEAERLTSEIARSARPLRGDVDVWVVSLDLMTRNPDALRKAAGQDASWSLLVFDEAHRLTPTSDYLGAAREAAKRTHHLLLLTATPHRGKELLFRHLLHLIDPQVYRMPDGKEAEADSGYLRPGKINFLRRMKEELQDNDGKRLFKSRTTKTAAVSLSTGERACYEAVMAYTDEWYGERGMLARTVYGKRAASSVHAARETLRRRRAALSVSQRGVVAPPSPFSFAADTHGENRGWRGIDDDEAWMDAEDAVVKTVSRDRRSELAALDALLEQLDGWVLSGEAPAKWLRMQEIVAEHGIGPGRDQLLVFTEYTDTAIWLQSLLSDDGYSVETLSGASSHRDREDLQRRFLRGDYQVLISTDAGGEGIDLQSANVMVAWDIPWSLVRLEQRAGRLHRIGQQRDVFVYNLVAPDTREGRVQEIVLNNLERAGEALSGRIFDVLDATMSATAFDYTGALVDAQRVDGAGDEIASRVPTSDQLASAAERTIAREDRLSSPANVEEALERFAEDRIESVNPVMVDGFLRKIAAARGWKVSPGPDTNIVQVDAGPSGSLPLLLGGGRRTKVAVSSQALQRLRESEAAIDGVKILGPTEHAFQSLIEQGAADYGEDLRRGAAAVDRASLTSYTLFVYTSEVEASDGALRRRRILPILVRSSAAGATYVSWESVANLEPSTGNAKPPSPAARHDADGEARAACDREEAREQKLRSRWVAQAHAALEELETRWWGDVRRLDTEQRKQAMAQFKKDKQMRLDDLADLDKVVVSPPQLVGWIRVEGEGRMSELGYDPDSEGLAVSAVVAELEHEGFVVDDRQTAGLGYDLLATRQRIRGGREQRLVEVKGQLEGLSAVRLESHEWGQAMQRGGDYWLYVVTDCAAAPQVSVRLRDPAGVLNGPTLIERFEIPASQLRKHATPPKPST